MFCLNGQDRIIIIVLNARSLLSSLSRLTRDAMVVCTDLTQTPPLPVLLQRNATHRELPLRTVRLRRRDGAVAALMVAVPPTFRRAEQHPMARLRCLRVLVGDFREILTGSMLCKRHLPAKPSPAGRVIKDSYG